MTYLVDIYSDDDVKFDPLPTRGVLSGLTETDPDYSLYGYTTLIPRYSDPWIGNCNDNRVVVQKGIFLTKLHWYSQGVLQAITDWNNIAVIGKVVAYSLLPNTSPITNSNAVQDIEILVHDIRGNGTIKSIFKRLETSITTAFPNAKCQCRRLNEIILLEVFVDDEIIICIRLLQSEVLSSYILTSLPIDCFGCCYDGNSVLLSQKAMYSFKYRTIVPDFDRYPSITRQRDDLIACAAVGFQVVDYLSDPCVFNKLAPEIRWTSPRYPRAGEISHCSPGSISLSNEIKTSLNSIGSKSKDDVEIQYRILLVNERDHPGPAGIELHQRELPNFSTNQQLTEKQKRDLLFVLEESITKNSGVYSWEGHQSAQAILQKENNVINHNLLRNIQIYQSKDRYEIFYDVPPLFYIVIDNFGLIYLCEGQYSDLILNNEVILPIQGSLMNSDNVFSLFEGGRLLRKSMRSKRLVASAVFSLIRCGVPVDCVAVVCEIFPFPFPLFQPVKKTIFQKSSDISSLVMKRDNVYSPDWFPTCSYSYYSSIPEYNCSRPCQRAPETSHFGRLFCIAVAADSEAAALANINRIESTKQWIEERSKHLMQQVEDTFCQFESLNKLDL